MTTNYHSPIPSSPPQPANASTFNGPLSELDTELTAQENRISAVEADMPVPSGSSTEYYDGAGNWSVPAGTGASVDGHVIQSEGVDMPQRAKIDFIGAGVTVTNEAGGTQVEIPGGGGGVTDHGDLTGLSDDDHPQYLLTTGLREWDEQGSNPSTPATGKWKLFFKSGGLYYIDDAGVVLGPLDPTLFLTKDGLAQWDEQGSSPSSPSASKMRLYFKSDEKLYKKNSSGTETEIGARTPGITNISPTTANITATLVTGGVSIHMADISGLTANRNFVLPAGTVGDIVELRINTGDDAFAFIVIGDTGVSINNGTAATEWSRLFIPGETVRFILTSTTNWAVLHDGRIACYAAMSDVNAQNIANATFTKVTFDTADANIGQCVDLANDKITIRRAGVYELTSQVYYHNFAAASLICQIYKNNAATGMPGAEESTFGMGTGSYGSPKALGPKTLAVGDYLELFGRQNSGSPQNPGIKPGSPAILVAKEILSS